MIFELFLVLTGLLALAAACGIFFLGREPLFQRAEAFPRNRIAGGILGVLVLLWCVPNIRPIIAEGGTIDRFLLPALIVAGILAIIYLDYLMARAVGGFCILAAHYCLKESFAFTGGHTTAYLAAAALLIGTFGICISGKPYWMRDLIRLAHRNPAVRYLMSAILIYVSGAGITAAVLFYGGRS